MTVTPMPEEREVEIAIAKSLRCRVRVCGSRLVAVVDKPQAVYVFDTKEGDLERLKTPAGYIETGLVTAEQHDRLVSMLAGASMKPEQR